MDPRSSQEASAIKRALSALRDMEAKLAAIERARNEPVAIIGAGCRFPGGASGTDAFWNLLRNGIDGICEVPSNRWSIDDFYSPDADQPGRMSTRWGGFVEDIEWFDAPFFELSPRTVLNMDPQQRLLLETSWEAMEHAGLPPDEWSGKPVGVYVGISSVDFAHLLRGHEEIDAYTGTGVAFSIAANRLSYFYDFRGPSAAVDTACSSSLVAAHMAVQSLRNRETDLALAGGVNLMLSPAVTIHLSRARFMAPDGRCKTFDASANGFVRGEGCGLIVLRRLSDAIAAGDRILAVIRGSAVNQDGRSAGLTAPNVLAQRAVIEAAVKQAGIRPEQVTLIEAHGTGTSLGDPIEVEALQAVYRRGDATAPCYLGSVKTNFGHLEAAAGVAGLIKAALALEHRTIPPHLNFKSLNPAITLSGTGMEIPLAARGWTASEGAARFAAVSSFGVGGTNAHIVLEEAPQQDESRDETAEEWILPLSARTPDALDALVPAYRQRIADGDSSLGDICYSAAVRRTHHSCRAAFSGSTSDLLKALGEFGGGSRVSERPIAFLYSGMGAQTRQAGRELMEREPVFRQAFEECAAAYSRVAPLSLMDPLPADRLDEPQFAQPLQFAVQVALTKLLGSWGIAPSAVLGHSVGEIAAAHACGALSLDEAATVVYHRSRLLNRLHGSGRMAAVPLPPAELEKLLAGQGGAVMISACNSPLSAVVAGGDGPVTEFIEGLRASGINCRYLQVRTPYHSPLVTPLQDELRSALRSIAPKRSSIPMASTVTGEYIDGEDLDARYWSRNMREPVLFAAGLATLGRSGHSLLVEIGAHPVLAAPASECLPSAAIVASLRRGEPERLSMLRSVGRLYTLGAAIDWKALYAGRGRYVELPSYPWQRRHFPLPNAQHAAPATPHPAMEKEAGSRDVSGLLAEAVASALGVDAATIDPHADLDDAGLDSIALLECLSRLEQKLGCSVPLSAVRTERLTLDSLSSRLTEHVSGTAVSRVAAEGERVSIECVIRGNGPAIVLFPPIAATAGAWQRQIEHLSQEFQMVVPHYPGYGGSTGLSDELSIESLADHIAAALRERRIKEPVRLVGWSIGGMVAQQFALRYPERTASILLVNTTCRLGIDNSFGSAMDLVQGLNGDFEQNFPERYVPQKAEYEELLREGTASCSSAVHLKYADLALSYDGRDALAQLHAPAMIVSGARDRLTPPAHGLELQRRIGGSTYFEIDAGHFAPLLAWEEFNRILRRFGLSGTVASAHSQGVA